MAKKKAPARKKGTRKSDDSGSNIGIVLVIVLIVAVALAWYWKNGATLPDFTTATTESTEQSRQTDEPPAAAYEPALRKDRKKEEPAVTVKPSVNTSTKANTAADKVKNVAVADAEEAPADYNRYYYTSSFDFAWPAYSQDDLVVEHEGYTLSYDEEIEQPKWVAYKITAANLKKKVAVRKDNFRPDAYVRTTSAHPDDYKNSGYDRGHLAAAADFAWSQEAMDGTFYMSNMSPQAPEFNRGVWKKLEEKVRGWGVTNSELFVVTGPIVERGAKKIGKNKVAVPQKYYKVVLDLSEPEVKGIGFILKNEGTTRDVMEFAVTIDSIEKITHLDFFPMVPDDLENALESSINKSLWK